MKSFAFFLLTLLTTSVLASDTVVPRVAAHDGDAIEKLLGQRAVVYGNVQRTNDYQGKMTFVNFPGQLFTLVCFAANYECFDKPPAELLEGKYVEVIGIIEEYRGKLQIKLENPNQLVKIEEAKEETDPPAAPEKPPGSGAPEEPRGGDPAKVFGE